MTNTRVYYGVVFEAKMEIPVYTPVFNGGPADVRGPALNQFRRLCYAEPHKILR